MTFAGIRAAMKIRTPPIFVSSEGYWRSTEGGRGFKTQDHFSGTSKKMDAGFDYFFLAAAGFAASVFTAIAVAFI